MKDLSTHPNKEKIKLSKLLSSLQIKNKMGNKQNSYESSGGKRYVSSSIMEKRLELDRRKVINTKYLNCGKCIDQRKSIRRKHDRIDEEAVARERFNRLGPGWL